MAKSALWAGTLKLAEARKAEANTVLNEGMFFMVFTFCGVDDVGPSSDLCAQEGNGCFSVTHNQKVWRGPLINPAVK